MLKAELDSPKISKVLKKVINHTNESNIKPSIHKFSEDEELSENGVENETGTTPKEMYTFCNVSLCIF